MNTKPIRPLPTRIFFTLLLAMLAALPASAQHAHYAVGMSDTNHNGLPDAGEPLAFVGTSGTAKTFHLLARPQGLRPAQRCGGYYMLDERPRTLFGSDGFSLIALSDGQIEAASPGHAHTGAYIWVEITSVTGPAGAHFGYWEENASQYFDVPTVSFATNQPTGSYMFVLSEGMDGAGEDPQGHIHGRSWTADKPGDYVLGFRLVDLSTSGPGGGPWHPPSQTYYYHFQAGPKFQPTGQFVQGTGFVLTWPSQMGIDKDDNPPQTGIVFTVERSTTLAPGSWQSIGSVTGTVEDTATFTDPAPPSAKAFYRLNYSWATP